MQRWMSMTLTQVVVEWTDLSSILVVVTIVHEMKVADQHFEAREKANHGRNGWETNQVRERDRKTSTLPPQHHYYQDQSYYYVGVQPQPSMFSPWSPPAFARSVPVVLSPSLSMPIVRLRYA